MNALLYVLLLLIGLEWVEYKPKKNLSDASWGTVLTDIENHIDPKHGEYYRDARKVTWTHETTHGIHSDIRNAFGYKQDSFGFYVGNDKIAMVKNPKLRIATVAESVDKSHRKFRYETYLVGAQKGWDNLPLYLLDEWVAYTNGAECGLELSRLGKYSDFKTDYTVAPLEFSVYALYVCKAVEKEDPDYDKKQLLAFTAWNIERSIKIYKEGLKYEWFNDDNGSYLKTLQEDKESKAIRQYVIEKWGKEWAKNTLGFEN